MILLQNPEFGTAALAAAKHHSVGLSEREGLLGPHRYQIALNLRHQPESETEDLAVDAVIESVSLLGSIDPYFFLQAMERSYI